MIVNGILSVGSTSNSVQALVDPGASGIGFIDPACVERLALPLTALQSPRELRVIDGRLAENPISHVAIVSYNLNGHKTKIPLFVTPLGHYEMVLGIPFFREHKAIIDFEKDTIFFNSQACRDNCNRHHRPIMVHSTAPKPGASITEGALFVSSAGLYTLARSHSLDINAASMDDITKAIAKLKPKDTTPEEQEREIRARVPEEYHEFIPLFLESNNPQLPPRRPYDHKIPLKPGTAPPHGALYSMSLGELEVLKAYLDENLKKGFIRASSSPAAAPVLFARKPGGGLRFCVDYRGLNEITIKNRYPVPLIQETLMRLTKAKFYTKLDARGAYNLLRIAEGEEWKTAFRTRLGLYEYNVMPFGLTNAPASWQHFINDVLHEFLDWFCTAYIDDILIYSETLKEHRKHVRMVLEALREHGVELEIDKCEFHTSETKFLGLIISSSGVSMDPAKVQCILDWETPVHLKEVQSFLGFANFYRRFIQDYSRVVAPLTALTRKDTPFVWSTSCQNAFDNLKQAFTTAPVLRHFDPDREIIVETDASDYVSAGIMSQYDDKGELHPVAFFSKKHSPAECNYEIYDKELLAIVRAFEEWRPHLESVPTRIKVLTDHKNLEYFMTTKLLNRRQARWSEFLSRFDFVITYRPGKQGGKPDALTRRPGDRPTQDDDERNLHQHQVLLKSHNLPPESAGLATSAPHVPSDPLVLQSLSFEYETPLREQIREAYGQDPLVPIVLSDLRSGSRVAKTFPLAESHEENGLIYYRDKLFIPEDTSLRLRLLRTHHDTPVAGHPGKAGTLELLSREYWWPSVRKDCDQYVRNCHHCKRVKASREPPTGLLKPLPIPLKPWTSISMDFVTQLPDSDGFDCILNVADRLSKQRHFIACHSDIDARTLGDLFIEHIFRLHGLPDDIISDRGPQFASAFWKQVCTRLGIDRRLSTAYHPQTDGQTEIFNAVMEQYLRAFVNHNQDNWRELLPMAEFTANNHVSASTKLTPFQVMQGFNPRFDANTAPITQEKASLDEFDAATFAQRMETIHAQCKVELAYSQAVMEEAYNRGRQTAPIYKPGDKVFIRTTNIKTTRKKKKLDWKRIGPYPIEQRVSSHAYRVKLPKTIKIHPVLPVSLLSRSNTDPYPGQNPEPPPPVEVEGQEEYEVQSIEDSKIDHGTLLYRVRWKGWADMTWEPWYNLENSFALGPFHKKYPDKPGPHVAKPKAKPKTRRARRS